MQQSFKFLFVGLTATLSIIIDSRFSNVLAQTPFRNSDCHLIRTLNNNFLTSLMYLGNRQTNGRTPQSSEGASVQIVQYDLVLGLISYTQKWRIINTDNGYILTTRKNGGMVNIEGASNGTDVVLHSSANVTHGQYWQIEPVQGSYRIRSLNNNFRNQNYRWLDGGSDGKTVSLVNGISHGTLWEIRSTGSCPSWMTRN
jgi:hypothetical protein